MPWVMMRKPYLQVTKEYDKQWSVCLTHGWETHEIWYWGFKNKKSALSFCKRLQKQLRNIQIKVGYQ